MSMLKRYDIEIGYYYGSGYYDGEEYSELRVKEDSTGEWVKAEDVLKQLKRMQHRIDRMQKRLDKHEGRE